MDRKKASDFPQELLNLFDGYVHGDIDRRAFMSGAQKFAVGGVTAAALFEMLKPNYAWAEQVAVDDKRIKVETVTVSTPEGTGKITGQLAIPAGPPVATPGDAATSIRGRPAKYPVVLVIHENRGLNPYVKDVGRRLAVANFISFAPDGLTSVGGYPGNDEEGGKLFGTVDRAKMQTDFVAAAKWLKARPDSNSKLGAVGFCFGGMTVNNLAVSLGGDLNAGVSFYGGAPTNPAEIAKINAPLLIQHGELDARLVGAWPAYDAALTAAKVTHEGYVYPKANHGFHNDTTPRYDEAAAKLAWERTLGWFNKYLRT